jgi:hypothetical protein
MALPNRMSLRPGLLWLTLNLALIILCLSWINIFFLNFTYPLRCLRVPSVEYHCSNQHWNAESKNEDSTEINDIIVNALIQDYCTITVKQTIARLLSSRLLHDYCHADYCTITVMQTIARLLSSRLLQVTKISQANSCIASSFWTSVISGFRRHVEIRALLGYYTASSGNPLPTFRDKISIPS